jgi:hypothetical protein
VTPSLRWSLRTLPAAAFALVLGLRPPLQLAPVSTAAAPSSRREFCSPTSATRSAAVTATRSHRRRWVVEFCHRGVGICTDINDHVPLQSDPALPVTRRDSRPQPSAWQRLRRRDGVDDRWPRSRSRERSRGFESSQGIQANRCEAAALVAGVCRVSNTRRPRTPDEAGPPWPDV